MLIFVRNMVRDHGRIFRYCLLGLVAFAITAKAGEPQGKPSGKAELKWKPFDAGFAEARRNDKKVLLDVYTDWCGWCKKLDKDVYSDGRVVKYLSEHYVVVKMNAEDSSRITYKDKTPTKTELAGYFGVRGYPTIIFFGSDGNPINSLPGYVDADRFLTIAKYIGEDFYKTTTWEDFQKADGAGNSKE